MDGYFLAHHGIKGQKWGVRRFQNEDGSLTSEGLDRYSKPRRKSPVHSIMNIGRDFVQGLKDGWNESTSTLEIRPADQAFMDQMQQQQFMRWNLDNMSIATSLSISGGTNPGMVHF